MLPAKTEHPCSSAAAIQPQKVACVIKVTSFNDPRTEGILNQIRFQLQVPLVISSGREHILSFPEGSEVSGVIVS